MPVPTSPTRLFVCDQCGATLPVEPEHAGRKCRCGQCGKVLTVPGDSPRVSKPKTPKFIGFNCVLCDSRLSAKVEDVGLNAKCPDCGKLTKVPPPPKPRPKKIPKAMHGQQYGLWDVDEGPLPQEIAARQPKFYPVWCGVCDTLMHAQAKQVGKKLTCPDCGAKTVFKKLPVEEKTKSAMVADGEEYQLDEASPPISRPVPLPAAVVDAEKHEQYRKGLRQEFGERPKMPRFPTLTGVLPMLFTGVVFGWAVALSCLVTLASTLALGGWGSEGYGAIMGMFQLALACVAGLLWFAASSALWCVILTESSEGSDRLYDPPSAAPYEWLGQMLYVGLAMAASPILGWALGTAFSEPVLGMAISAFVCFPIALLSSLERSSPLEIVSTRIFGSLVRRPGHWLLFYLQTGLLMGLFLMGTQLLGKYLLLAIPLGMFLSVVYFRLLGRLAWWLAESMPEMED